MLADFVAAGWLQPVLAVHRMVVYSLRELDHCVIRLEAGETPIPDDNCTRPKVHGMAEQELPSPLSTRSFFDQLQRMMSVPPLLLRPAQAATFLSSLELLDEMRKSGWIRPVFSRHRLTLFSVRHL